MRAFDLGAIAILDVLGFKGIWMREDPRSVISHMIAIRQKCIRLQGEDFSGVLVRDSGFRYRVRCMSDTIVITVVLKGQEPPVRGLYKAAFAAAIVAGTIMIDALDGMPPFLFRGCLAVGELKEQSNFLIGPAVDEAAERFELAHGPFLWLAPSVLDIRKRYEETYLERITPSIMIPYTLPLNNGETVRTQVFSYFGLSRSKSQRKEVRERILRAFGTRPVGASVQAKRKNIIKFLTHLERAANSGKLDIVPKFYRLPDWEDLSPDQKTTLALRGIYPNSPLSPYHGRSRLPNRSDASQE